MKPFPTVFELLQRSQVWLKGSPIVGYDPAIWRRDKYGRAMNFHEYGNRSHTYGWEIDHIVPQWLGGSNDTSNLQPLQWESNVAKGPLPPLPIPTVPRW